MAKNMIKDIDGIHYYILSDNKMQSPQLNLSKQHLEVLSYTDSLFSRWALRKNSYLFKHIKPNLQIPLYIIAEERRIAQITQTQSTIIQALKLSEFVDFDEDARTVKIIDLPTLKFRDQAILLAFETTLKKYIDKKFHSDNAKTVKPLQYVVSNKTDDGFYYVVLKSKQPADKQALQQLVGKIGQGSSFLAEPLYEQLKEAHSKLRKSKRESQQRDYPHNSNYSNRNETNNYNNLNSQQIELSNPVYSRNNMMHPWMYYPMYGTSPEQMQMYANQTPIKSYGIFIRKAVDSDDQPEPVAQQCLQKSDKNNNIQNPLPQPTQIQPHKKQQQKQSQRPSKQQQQQQLPQSTKQKKDEKQNTANNSGNKQSKGKIILDDNDFPTIG